MEFKQAALALIIGLSATSQAAVVCKTGTMNTWSSGFVMRDIALTNTGSRTVSAPKATLEFQQSVAITDSWGGSVSGSGKRFTIVGTNYNANLSPGETANITVKGEGRPGTVKCLTADSSDSSNPPETTKPSEPTSPSNPTPPSGTAVWSENFGSKTAGARWFNMDNTKIIDNCGTGKGKCLQTRYVPTSTGSNGFHKKIAIPRGTHYTLSYDIQFMPGFEFVRGGKLPGLTPDNHTTGCKATRADGWSARPMWRGVGSAQAYYYGQDRAERCGDGVQSRINVFKPGQWQKLELEVKLNKGRDDYTGEVILRVDGAVVSRNSNLRLRATTTAISEITQFYFSSFYGGNDSSWSPSKPTYIRFDNFRVVDKSN